jgi:hypothetical protein
MSKRDALEIVRQESMRKFKVKPDSSSHHNSPRHIIAVLAFIADSATPLAELDAVMYCYGLLGRGEESMTDIGARHGISRQAFSKKVERAAIELVIAPRGGMRPTAQKKIYTDVQRARWAVIDQDAPTKP